MTAELTKWWKYINERIGMSEDNSDEFVNQFIDEFA